MGGSKSKPVVESARKVLEKRVLNDTPLNSSIKNVSLKYTPDNNNSHVAPSSSSSSSKQSVLDEIEINNAMFKDMSKFPTIKTSTAYENQILSKKPVLVREKTAVLIRIEQEQIMNNKEASNESKQTILNGRLTEAQLMRMYDKFRDSKINAAGFTVQQAAIDFSIPEATVTSLLAMARSPTIKRDIESAELAIAE